MAEYYIVQTFIVLTLTPLQVVDFILPLLVTEIFNQTSGLERDGGGGGGGRGGWCKSHFPARILPELQALSYQPSDLPFPSERKQAIACLSPLG